MTFREKPPLRGGGLSETSDTSEVKPSRQNTQVLYQAPAGIAVAMRQRASFPPGARVIQLVPPARPRRLEIQISVSDGRAPVGRTRPLRLRESDLAWLLEAAERLEARR
jgi:hypothetical protein